MSQLVGQKLGHYRIVEKIGEGGMGEVYRAQDERLGRDVAIKVLPEHFAEDPARRERFEREARAVSSLNHPNICTLHDIGQHDGIDFIVMEYIEGETLAGRLENGALPLEQALEVGVQIADGLDKAHRRGIVHRDLKPGNIMLTKNGAKLLDFGLAKLGAPDAIAAESALATEDKPLTAEGTLVGTVQYMAPEQLEGKEADARTDVFAFGAVLYEMITGEKAFEGRSRASLISVLEGLHTSPTSGLVYFAVSNAGTLAFLPGRQGELERQLVSVDRQGVGTPVVDERGNFVSPRYSPDGTKVAVERFEGSGRRAIWVFDLISGSRIRLTTGGENGLPVWTPHGDRITFWNDYETIHSKVVGADAVDKLHYSPHPVFPASWTPGGEDLVFVEFHPETRADIWVLPEDGEAKAWIATEFAEGYPRLSPDGRWLAYISNESGRYEVYVQAYPGAGEKITVSTDGGYEPVWSPDGRELFYRIGKRMMVASIQTSPVFRSSRPRELFEGPYLTGSEIAAIATTYDVAPDGEHFLMIEGGEEEGANQLHLVLNWFEELQRLAPTD